MDDRKAPPIIRRPFMPVKRSNLLLGITQQIIRTDLFLNNRVHIDPGALELLNSLPKGTGVVLASNHADERDPSVCMELSRRSKKSFSTMCNREAFEEMLGFAGFMLQRLGYFSIERGTRDTEALTYAIDVVKQSRDILVIFPEGEIFYMNEEVQPLHSGVAEIGMQAIVGKRQTDPDWTAYIVPMAIKYHYTERLDDILDHRISKMEARLLLRSQDTSFAGRLLNIQKTLLQRKKVSHQVTAEEWHAQGGTQEVRAVQHAMLSQIEERHKALPATRKTALDRSWQLGAELRDSAEFHKSKDRGKELRQDLEDLRVIAQLSSWRPHYYTGTDSQDRLAEVVLKLERELYKVERPKQLAKREVHVNIAPPIDLGAKATKYQEDPYTVRREVTDHLHDQIQALVDQLSGKHQK